MKVFTPVLPKSNSRSNPGLLLITVLVAIGALTLLMPNLAAAADLFTAAKTDIKDTAGTGSGVEMAILALGGIGALVFGFMSKNWVGAIGGFAVGVIFWNVITPMIFV